MGYESPKEEPVTLDRIWGPSTPQESPSIQPSSGQLEPTRSILGHLAGGVVCEQVEITILAAVMVTMVEIPQS